MLLYSLHRPAIAVRDHRGLRLGRQHGQSDRERSGSKAAERDDARPLHSRVPSWRILPGPDRCDRRPAREPAGALPPRHRPMALRPGRKSARLRLVDPVPQVADVELVLGLQIGDVRLGDVFHSDATRHVMNIHKERHEAASLPVVGVTTTTVGRQGLLTDREKCLAWLARCLDCPAGYLGWGADTHLGGLTSRRGPGRDADLGQHRRDMMMYCPLGNERPARDFLVRQAL